MKVFRTVVLIANVIAVLSVSASAAQLMIEMVRTAQPGTQEIVSITASQLPSDISGFRLAVAIDDGVYPVMEVIPGEFLQTCQWEYFNYRTVNRDLGPNYNGLHRHGTSVLEITGFASVTAGHQTSCANGSQEIELAKIRVMVADVCSYPELACTLLPVRFYWRDCDDNVLYTMAGDSALGAIQLQEYSQMGLLQTVSYPFPGYGTPDQSCTVASGRTLVPALTAMNGGLDLVCADSLTCPGDLNADGFPNTIADIVTFANYFAYGLTAFGPHVQASIDASDVNADGVTLSLDDLAYLVRVVNGDAPAYPRGWPSAAARNKATSGR